MSDKEKLGKLFDDETGTVKVSSGRVEIKKIRVKNIPLVIDLMECVQDKFENEEEIDQNKMISFLMSEKYESVIKIVSSFTSTSLDDFEEMEIDDAMIIITGIIKVNKSFLETTLVPLIEELATAIEG